MLQFSSNVNVHILREISCRSMISNLRIMLKCVIINTERETKTQVIKELWIMIFFQNIVPSIKVKLVLTSI